MTTHLKGRGSLIIVVLVTAALVLTVFLASHLLQTHREYSHFRERERSLEAELAEARSELADRENYRDQMDDPEFIERIARERLGYARPNELLFRFSDEL